MAKKRPQSKGGGTKQKKPKKAPTGQRPSLAPRATGVVTTSKAKRKKKDDKPPPAQGRKALVVKPARGVAVAETVQLWNVFRKKAIDEATRKKTVDAALSALTGKLYEASLKHDSARVVQALHKFGDASQRAKIEAELVPRLGELAIRPYARHVALALVKRAADSSQRSTRCRAVRGKFRQIAVHAVGAKVADALLQTAPKRDAVALRRELYSVPDADLLKAETLSEILAEVEDRRRAPILLGVDATLSKLCDKGLAHYAFAHDLLYERCSSLHNLRELASRTAEAHPHFVSTRSGARASALLATAADAKTRKGLLKKCWRSRAAQASLHARAHIALIRFLDVVDDTKQTGSLISGELGPACAELALDACGAQVLLSLLVDASSKHLSADVKDVLREDPSSVTIEGAPASRKPRDQRRRELCGHVAPGLKKALETRAPQLLASRSAAPVVVAALSVQPLLGDAALLDRVARACLAPAAAFSMPDEDVEAKNPHFGGGSESSEDEEEVAGSGGDDDAEGDSDDEDSDSDSSEDARGAFFEKSDDDDSSVGDVVAAADATGDWGVADSSIPPPVLDDDVAHRTLLSLLQARTEGFAEAFSSAAKEAGGLERWAGSNRGALVLAALVRARPATRKELSKVRKKVKATTKGAAALLEALDE